MFSWVFIWIKSHSASEEFAAKKGYTEAASVDTAYIRIYSKQLIIL